MFRRSPHHLLALVAVLPACVRHLPPAPTPAAVAPQMQPAPPPAPGMGRLLVDVTDGPVRVQRVNMTSHPIDAGQGRTVYRFTEEPVTLCAVSPCATDVSTGNLLLGFPVIGKDSLEVELVHVGPEPSVYRRTLSIYTEGDTSLAGVLSTTFGGAALITGATLLPIGLATDTPGMTLAGGISLGAGTALLVWGIWALRKTASTFRPGASNHFPLAATP